MEIYLTSLRNIAAEHRKQNLWHFFMGIIHSAQKGKNTSSNHCDIWIRGNLPIFEWGIDVSVLSFFSSMSTPDYLYFFKTSTSWSDIPTSNPETNKKPKPLWKSTKLHESLCFPIQGGKYISGQLIIFQQPRFPWKNWNFPSSDTFWG